jgi:hypothetical protein
MAEPEQDRSHKLDYLNPKPSDQGPPPSFDDRRFLVGLGGGVAASALIWFSFFPYFDTNPQSPTGFLVYSLLVVPVAKIFLAIVLIKGPSSWRSSGFGLLLSIPVGALIFFGACAVNWKGL